MKVAIILAFLDHSRTGLYYRSLPQPQIGPLIAALLPDDVDIDVINETLGQPDWTRDYDLVFISSLHSDFDRARQLSHYWRRRGAKTVYGGPLASAYPELCRPFFDTVAIGDAEGTVPQIFADFRAGELQPVYVCGPYDPRSTPVPRFDLLARQQQVPLSFEATRGCPFTCDFCTLTGAGTRFHARPVDLVMRDIGEGRAMLRGPFQALKRHLVMFSDNNIGGNPAHLRKLCAALEGMRILWGGAVTYNVLSDPEFVTLMSRSGCRAMFVGLESFNPATIDDMNKKQNDPARIREVVDRCRGAGILILAGMLVSPTVDDCRYIDGLPERLRECGLYVPGLLSIECPIPGTPYFHRLADQEEPAFLPRALLRDFNGYVLTVRPRREPLDRFVESYANAVERVYSPTMRLSKFLDDLRILLRNGHVLPAIVDALHLAGVPHRPHPDRTYVTGSDVAPIAASNVPFGPDDFRSPQEKSAILEPMRVTDDHGHVLPVWRRSIPVFKAKGRLSDEAQHLASRTVGATHVS